MAEALLQACAPIAFAAAIYACSSKGWDRWFDAETAGEKLKALPWFVPVFALLCLLIFGRALDIHDRRECGKRQGHVYIDHECIEWAYRRGAP